MAYENYTQVTWANGTPITADRLQQMSINTDQVKDSTDLNPRGIIQMKTISSGDFSYSDFDTYHEIINLKNEGAGNPNYSVTLPRNRYARLVLQFPGFFVESAGAEDATFYIRFTQGSLSGSPTELRLWKISPASYTFINNASGTAITNAAIKGDGYYFGAGVYTHIFESGDGLKESDSSGIFNIQVYRELGASSTNAPTYKIKPTATESIIFYLEDVGGKA
jgi:hypothetical protein